MIPGWVLLLVSLSYVGLLFGVAHRRCAPAVSTARLAATDRVRPGAGGVLLDLLRRCRQRGAEQPVPLAHLPRPGAAFVFGIGLMERLNVVAKARNITSIADFIASRFGKSRCTGRPGHAHRRDRGRTYIALQFKAVALSIDVLSQGRHRAGAMRRCTRTRRCTSPDARPVRHPVR